MVFFLAAAIAKAVLAVNLRVDEVLNLNLGVYPLILQSLHVIKFIPSIIKFIQIQLSGILTQWVLHRLRVRARIRIFKQELIDQVLPPLFALFVAHITINLKF